MTLASLIAKCLWSIGRRNPFFLFLFLGGNQFIADFSQIFSAISHSDDDIILFKSVLHKGTDANFDRLIECLSMKGVTRRTPKQYV